MSTPPIRMRPPRRPVNLTTVITVFALIFGLAFGICSVSGISLSNGGDPRSAYKLIAAASVMGGICVACLMAIAVIAFFRSRGKT